MKSIKEVLPKPSDAINAMIVGLMEIPKKNKNFKVDMGTFGTKDGNICYGCAATCTTFQALNKKITGDNIDGLFREESNQYPDDIGRFESVIDELRMGDLDFLFEFYGLDIVYPDEYLSEIYSDFTPEDLEPYEQYRDKLIKLGL